MKENVSSHTNSVSAVKSVPLGLSKSCRDLYINDLQSSGVCSGYRDRHGDVNPRCLPLRTESEAGVVGAGPEGAGPQRTSATLHLPRAAPGPAQRRRHASQNLHTPQEVRGARQEEEGHWASCIYILICIILQFTHIHFLYLPPVNHITVFLPFFSPCSHLLKM